MGDARRTERSQCASSLRLHGTLRDRAQRHHRECRRNCARSCNRRRRDFRSETDSEVLAHLIAAMPAERLEDAVRARTALVTGTYGVAVIDAERPGFDRRRAQRQSSRARDRRTGNVRRIRSRRARATYPERRPSRRRRNRRGAGRWLRNFHARRRRHSENARNDRWTDESYEKGDFAHFMRKEIAEQPEAIRRTLSGRLDMRFQHDTHRRT